MSKGMTRLDIEQDSDAFRGSGGVSEENRALGFRPAFRDVTTGQIFLSLNTEGDTASCHLIDGLPDAAVAARDASGRPTLLKPSVVAGFLRDGSFYTREEAAAFIDGQENRRRAA